MDEVKMELSEVVDYLKHPEKYHKVGARHPKWILLYGEPGSGKTLLSLLAALSQTNIYPQILLARPIVALSNKDIGFLPGDINDKIDPYWNTIH